jgi:ribonuclease E
VEAAQDLSAWENIILHSHYTMEYRRRRLNDRTDRQDHDSDNFDGNDSFQDNDNDNSHLNGNDNFDDKDNGNAHLNDNANFDDNDNFDGNDVDDNDNLDSNDSIVTESEQEYFLNFSSNVQRNQDGGAAGPPVSK